MFNWLSRRKKKEQLELTASQSAAASLLLRLLRPSRWGSPPAWVDWIHKLGPLIGIIGGLILFGITWHFTVEPVYKRALLEERNAKLEIEHDGLGKNIKKLEQRQEDLHAALKSKEADIRTLQETIVKKEKEADLLTANAERQLDAVAALRTSAEALRTELTKSKDDLSGAERRLRQARAEAEKAFDVLRVKTMTAFEDRVMNACLIPALSPYSRFLWGAELAAQPWSFTRFGDCFTSVLKNEDFLYGLPEVERHQFKEFAARLDKGRVTRLLSLDQEIKAITAEATRLFSEAKGIQMNRFIGGPPPVVGAGVSDVDEPIPMGKELLRSLDMQKEATKLLEHAMPRFFEQYKATIVQDLAALRSAFLAHRLEP